jgi:hypothetical protein
MIKLKKNEPIKYNGVLYNLSGYDQAKLWQVYNNNPMLRHLFEIVVDEDIEFVEDKVQEFFEKHKPKHQSEEEFFEEKIKEVVKPKRVRKKK